MRERYIEQDKDGSQQPYLAVHHEGFVGLHAVEVHEGPLLAAHHAASGSHSPGRVGHVVVVRRVEELVQCLAHYIAGCYVGGHKAAHIVVVVAIDVIE